MVNTASPPHAGNDARWSGDGKTGVLIPILSGLALMVALPAAFVFFIAPPPLVEATKTSISFNLHASSGGTLSSADLAERPYLIFFGFTHCPDVCPTTLAELSALTAELSAMGRSIRQFFVTIDPARDTPDVLREYLSSFEGDVTGLTGSDSDTAAISKQFDVRYNRVPLADGDYTMEHTATVFVVDPVKRVIEPLPVDHDAALTLLRNAIDGAPRSIAYSVKGAVTTQSPMAEFLKAVPSPDTSPESCKLPNSAARLP